MSQHQNVIHLVARPQVGTPEPTVVSGEMGKVIPMFPGITKAVVEKKNENVVTKVVPKVPRPLSGEDRFGLY